MIFRTEEKEYACATAVEIVRQLERDATNYTRRGGTLRQFLLWSLAHLDDRIHSRELDLSNALNDEQMALSYLCLCDEYGVGKLTLESLERRTG